MLDYNVLSLPIPNNHFPLSFQRSASNPLSLISSLISLPTLPRSILFFLPHGFRCEMFLSFLEHASYLSLTYQFFGFNFISSIVMRFTFIILLIILLENYSVHSLSACRSPPYGHLRDC